MDATGRVRGREGGATGRRSTAALVAMPVLVGLWALWTPPPAAAQPACETVRGTRADSIREVLRERMAVRDSVRAILAATEVDEPEGVLVVRTDEVEAETDLTLVDLDPPQEALHRIGGFLADHFEGVPPEGRNLVVELDAPTVRVEDDEVEFCHPWMTNDDEIAESLERIARHHPYDGDDGPKEVEGRVEGYVGWRGEVVHAAVSDSTGDPWFNAALAPLLLMMEFEPATVDGVPVGVEMERRVRLEAWRPWHP